MTVGKKGTKNERDKCEACDVLGDYMCSGMPDDSPGQAQNKKTGDNQQS